MEGQAAELLASEGFSVEQMRFDRFLDLRDVGQLRALGIPVSASAFTAETLAAAIKRFHSDYRFEFKYAVPELPVESKGLRLVATGVTIRPEFPADTRRGSSEEAVIGEARAFFRDAGGLVPTVFYDRKLLLPESTFEGPAIVEQYDSTTVVPPGAQVSVDEFRNLQIKVW